MTIINKKQELAPAAESEDAVPYFEKGPLKMERKTEKNILGSATAERLIRRSVQLPARLTTGDKEYSGAIINISCRGVGMYVITKFSEGTIDCACGSVLKLETRSPVGELWSMQGKIKWLRIQKQPGGVLTTNIGIEIVDPPEGLIKLLNRLQ